MRPSRFALLGTPLLLAATIAAQIPPIPPAITKFSATTTATGFGNFEPLTFSPLNATAMGATGQVGQIELRQLISNNRNFFRVAATVTGLNVANGGKGNWDVVEGTYDAQNQILTASNRAAAFNLPTAEFALTISEDGLIGACDDNGGLPKFSQRASAGAVFPATQQITGIPAGFVDPKLYKEGNAYRIAWVNPTTPQTIWAGDFTAGGNVVNQAEVIPLSVIQGGATAYTAMHSPHAITEEIPAGSGNWVLHGWLVSAQIVNDSDSMFVPIADPASSFFSPARGLVLWDEPGWQNNASTLGAGGSSFWAFGEPSPRSMPMVAMTGSSFRTTVNDSVHLHVMTEFSNTDVWQMTILFGAPIGPIPLNFAIGNPLGQPQGPTLPPGLLGNTGIIALNLPVTAANKGFATASFNIAAGTVPANVPIPMQVIGLNASTLKLYTGNTANLEGL